jgi:hypothetical protein
MPFRINCPKCQTPFTCPDDNRGKRLQCSKCGQQFLAGSAPAASGTSAAVQAQPNRAATPATQRVAPPEPIPNAGPPIAASLSPAKLILLGLAAALVVGVLLGSAGTYWIMRSKETAPTPSQPEQVAQAMPNTIAEKQKNPNAEPSTPSRTEPTPEDITPQKADEEDVGKPVSKSEPKTEPKSEPKPEPKKKPSPVPAPGSKPAKPADPPVRHGSTLGRKATNGEPFTYQLSRPEGKAKYAKVEGPQGLEISEDGLLTWTPNLESIGRISVQARVNGAGIDVYFIEVIGSGKPKSQPVAQGSNPPVNQGSSSKGGDPPVRHGSTLPRKATAGQLFTYQLSTPNGPAKYVKTDGPAGLEISEDGLVRWTPEKNTSGNFKFFAKVNNAGIEGYSIEVVDTTDYRMTLLPLSPPTGFAMTSDNVTLIVALADKGQLVYFDTVTNKEVKRVDVDFQPGSLALQGDTLFAAAKGGSQVYALETMTGKVKKEFSVGSDAIAHLACHPSRGLLYASNNKFDVYSINPANGTATKTKAKGFFLAVDPVEGKYVYAGAQPPDRDEIVFKEGADGSFRIYWDRWGRRAFIMKYAIAGDDLKYVSGQNNAAVNGWWMHLTPDGKRIMIVGGGGWRPKEDGAGGGYVTAVYNSDNLQSMVGQAPHGLNIAFHPDLNVGLTNHYGSELTLFNARSLTKRQTIPICKAQERRPSVLTFGGKGTKIILWNGPDVSFKQGLYFIPLELKDEEKTALEKKYGKLPAS